MYIFKVPKASAEVIPCFQVLATYRQVGSLWSAISLIYLSNGNRWGARKG